MSLDQHHIKAIWDISFLPFDSIAAWQRSFVLSLQQPDKFICYTGEATHRKTAREGAKKFKTSDIKVCFKNLVT